MTKEITEEIPKKKPDEKICADCMAREYFTNICLPLGFKIKRTDLACNAFVPRR
jgi:hypothetical protein